MKGILVKDWVDFNKDFYNGDVIVKLFKNERSNENELIMKTLVNMENCKLVFGDYILRRFHIGNTVTNHHTLELLIFNPNK